MTENDIAKLDELPQLSRLETVLLANNKIAAIEPNFAEVCPKLDSLILTNNRLARLDDIDQLGTCNTLQRLSLMGNLVCNLPDYRLYTIHKIPSLKVLDFQMVTRAEREAARKQFGSDSTQHLVETTKMEVEAAETATGAATEIAAATATV